MDPCNIQTCRHMINQLISFRTIGLIYCCHGLKSRMNNANGHTGYIEPFIITALNHAYWQVTSVYLVNWKSFCGFLSIDILPFKYNSSLQIRNDNTQFGGWFIRILFPNPNLFTNLFMQYKLVRRATHTYLWKMLHLKQHCVTSVP